MWTVIMKLTMLPYVCNLNVWVLFFTGEGRGHQLTMVFSLL